MFQIRGIDHIVLRIKSREQSLAFYCDQLGCQLEREIEELGLIQLRAGNCLIDLVPIGGKLGSAGGKAPGAEGRNLDHLCLRIEPFDPQAIKEKLAAAGIAVGEPARRYGAEGYGPSLYIEDPDGNVVELKGPPEEAS